MPSERKKIVAPTDPKAKGKFFYLYKDLKFEAFLRPSGRRTCENYLDGGRIKSAIKINGGITDEKILDMFDNAKDTIELIKGVGVEITSKMDNAGFDFGIVFYGQSGEGSAGTYISSSIVSNGVEVYIDFDEVDFSDNDRVLGRLEIEFPYDLEVAAMTVKIYVDDKYDIPYQVEDDAVDITSPEYTSMIKNSLYSIGNNERFMNAVEKAKAGKDVTIAFIGGSITQGAGAVPQVSECYAYKTYEGFKHLIERKAGIQDADNIHYIRAGIGGTPSELGVVRYDKDVRSFGQIEPDIVVVEFAVNDDGDETGGDCYEGLMRKIWFSKNKPALILLFSVFADDYNLQERFIPLGEKYGVPMVSVKNAVTPQFTKTTDNGRVLSKRQYFYDIFHPSNIGHTIMADCIINYFNEAVKKPVAKDIDNPPVVRSDDFDKLIYFDRKYSPESSTLDYVNQIDNLYKNQYLPQCNVSEGDIQIQPGGFISKDTSLQEVERNLDGFPTPCFQDNWMHEPGSATPDTPFTLTLECKLLMIIFKDTESDAFGVIDIKVDGKTVRKYDPKEIGWTHCNAIIAIREKISAKHTVEIGMAAGDEMKRATILGFGYVR